MKSTIQAALTLWAAACIACLSPPKGPPAYCNSEVAFTQQLTWCAGDASTRAESRACRKAVHEACGVTETVSEASHDR